MTHQGLVDLQVNGYKGTDFSDEQLNRQDFIRAGRALVEAGTGKFLPTIITSKPETYRRNLTMMAEVMDTDLGNNMPGIHIEGPFISATAGAVGAHNPEWVLKPSPEFLAKMQEWASGKVKNHQINLVAF